MICGCVQAALSDFRTSEAPDFFFCHAFHAIAAMTTIPCLVISAFASGK